MSGLIVFIVLALLAGIIYLEAQARAQKKPREKVLAELAKSLDGRLEPMVEFKDSYQLLFAYEGKNFVLEDILVVGFNESFNKAFLKLKTETKLNLSMAEKKVTVFVRPELILASQIPDELQSVDVKLKIPQEFQIFKIATNDVEAVNTLFAETKLLPFFRQCKNMDSRGSSFMSFKIVNGLLVLEFQSIGHWFPNLNLLYKDVRVINDYLDPMNLIAEILSKPDHRNS